MFPLTYLEQPFNVTMYSESSLDSHKIMQL